jgi:hypothetical protein
VSVLAPLAKGRLLFSECVGVCAILAAPMHIKRANTIEFFDPVICTFRIEFRPTL